MSYVLRVFCRSAEPVTRRDLADFITDGAYFGEPPRFDPPREAPEAEAKAWTRLGVHYAPGRRPVIFGTSAGGETLRDEVTDALAEIEQRTPPSAGPELAARITASRQIVTVEVDRPDMTEEAWFMVDAVDAYLARRLDGLVYAEGDGVFDDRLQPLVKWK